jgi:hypothetical protein
LRSPRKKYSITTRSANPISALFTNTSILDWMGTEESLR